MRGNWRADATVAELTADRIPDSILHHAPPPSLAAPRVARARPLVRRLHRRIGLVECVPDARGERACGGRPFAPGARRRGTSHRAHFAGRDQRTFASRRSRFGFIRLDASALPLQLPWTLHGRRRARLGVTGGSAAVGGSAHDINGRLHRFGVRAASACTPAPVRDRSSLLALGRLTPFALPPDGTRAL